VSLAGAILIYFLQLFTNTMYVDKLYIMFK